MDFYVLSGTEETARLRFGCRLVEQAYLAGKRVFVWADDPVILERFDEMLWTFADRSFVPHEPYGMGARWAEAPVLLGSGAQPEESCEVLLNLGGTVPAAAARAGRIVELIDADEQRRRAGRNRFRQYREQGLAPETHTVTDDSSP